MINAVNIIRRKRDGHSHDDSEIESLIRSYTTGEVTDYQMSAWLMAAFLNGMDDNELFSLTKSMLYSGQVLDLSDIPGKKVDKHSTGGVGDKISLILAPLVAACGVPVPMISGRGLGHTGGTLDKLEAIPGFRTNLSIEHYKAQLRQIGAVLIGQTEEIAPADRKLYALRDVTATVEFIPFIAASIMSKKLAEGIDALVLDVKTGRGAFMKTEEDARNLAMELCEIGTHFGKDCTAWITRMDSPLGYGVGSWPETQEAIRCLHGENVTDVMEIVYTLASEMLVLGGSAEDTSEARKTCEAAIYNGNALDKFIEIVERQGGDPTVVEDPTTRIDFEMVAEAPATATGYVNDINAYDIGLLAVEMGAGRMRKEDQVDPLAGLILLKKPGDAVQQGEPIARLYTGKLDRISEFSERATAAFSVSSQPPDLEPLLVGRLANGTWTSN
ncbi:MAG: thymidine phosphorylase [Rhodothermales bacterium]|nr:thymidine phosphorylase [Rhodothermales bacterium]